MNASDELFEVMVDLECIRTRIRKLNRKYHLNKKYPGIYDTVLCGLSETSSNLADFCIAYAELIIEE